MPNANYYREQARLLLSWARAASDSKVAERLTVRAQEMLELAARSNVAADAADDALDVVDATQMPATRRHDARQDER
jgi:hypothetical protein